MSTERNLSGLVVLVVEDEAVCRDVVRNILTMQGVAVTAVADAEQAVIALGNTSFDAIVTDICLPGMDGLMLLRHVRNKNPDLPVILMTGFSSVVSAVEALKLGAQDYLLKPLEDPQRLVGTVWAAADRYRLSQRNRALQAQLKSNEEKFRALFNNASDMIIVHGLNEKGETLHCSEVNDSASRLLDYTRKDLHTRNFLDLVAGEHRAETAHAMKELLSKDRVSFETVLIASRGWRIPVEVNATVFCLGGTRLVLSVVRDISERRETERIIAEAAEQDRLMLGRELHDVLCQDLTSMAMLASVLTKTITEESSKGVSDANMIHDMAKRSVSLCKQLSSGLFPVELDMQGLDAALEQLAHAQERIFHVSCTFRNTGNVHFSDKSAALHAYRIAQEAVRNAMRHSGAHSVSIVLSKERERSTLSIEDDGQGMASESGKEGCMGISIMKFRARMMGATLNVKPREGGGTLITCSWS